MFLKSVKVSLATVMMVGTIAASLVMVSKPVHAGGVVFSDIKGHWAESSS